MTAFIACEIEMSEEVTKSVAVILCVWNYTLLTFILKDEWKSFLVHTTCFGFFLTHLFYVSISTITKDVSHSIMSIEIFLSSIHSIYSKRRIWNSSCVIRLTSDIQESGSSSSFRADFSRLFLVIIFYLKYLKAPLIALWVKSSFENASSWIPINSCIFNTHSS